MKRFICAFLSFLLALSPLFGCAGKKGSGAASSEAPSASPSEAPAPDAEALIASLPIEESEHPREEAYMTAFSSHALILPGFTVHMENLIYDEPSLRAHARTILYDLSAAEKALGAKPGNVTVFLLNATVDPIPAAVGSRVFCTEADLADGAYRAPLMTAAYGLSCEWQAVGLSGLVYDGFSGDSELNEYYASGENDLTASCSPLHLAAYFAGEETAEAARRTALSITKYLIEAKGFEAFRAARDTAPILPGWAESIGLAAAPVLPSGSARIADMRAVPNKRFTGIFRLDNFTVYVREDAFIRTADELYKWSCGYLEGMDTVLAQIESEAPIAFQTAAERFREPIDIFMIDADSYTYAYPRQNRIDLSRSNAVWHETVHLIMEPREENEALGWICEGLAEHFSYNAASEYCREYYVSRGFGAYLEFFEEQSGKEATEDDLFFHGKVWELYGDLRSGDAEEYDDVGAYCRAFGICTLLLNDVLERTQIRKLYDLSVAEKRGAGSGRKNTDGNALTYPEAALFTEYLFETCGADETIEAYWSGSPIKKAFGISYPELYRAVIGKLLNDYPQITAARAAA